MEQELFHSDLRVCAPGEPKSGLGDQPSRMTGRSAKTGNDLSKIESQGFRR
jgi:hypothetical protein